VAEKLRETQPTSFLGFGEASTMDEATAQAAADLVRQIQTRISSEGTSQETTRSVEISSLTRSTVDALLTGLSTAKRCRQGTRWEAVVTLERAAFFRNIQVRVAPVLREAGSMRESLQSVAVSRGEILSVAARAKSFMKTEGQPARDLLSICRTFNSCMTTDPGAFDGLEAAANRVFSGFSFHLRAADPEAVAVSESISRLLGEEGFALSSSGSAPNIATAACERKDFPPMVQTGFMVTELVCSVSFAERDGQTVSGLVRSYRGHGLGESREEALREARRKIERKS
jgi:hypothetical protein